MTEQEQIPGAVEPAKAPQTGADRARKLLEAKAAANALTYANTPFDTTISRQVRRHIRRMTAKKTAAAIKKQEIKNRRNKSSQVQS